MAMLNLLIDEGCCGIEFIKFEQQGGDMAVSKWECPVCGCEWRANVDGGIVNWQCCDTIQIWR